LDFCGLQKEKNCSTYLEPNFIAAVTAREFELGNGRVGLPPSNGYVNSGVVLFNLDMWRKHKLFEKCIRYARTMRPYSPNQDTLNAVCYGKIKSLSPVWNAQIFKDTRILPETYRGFFDALNAPGILHFLTQEKPWHPHVKRFPEVRRYFDYLKFTPWKNYVYAYWFQRLIFYFDWTAKRKTIRIFGIPVLNTFRGKGYVFGIPAFGEYDAHWKTNTPSK